MSSQMDDNDDDVDYFNKIIQNASELIEFDCDS